MLCQPELDTTTFRRFKRLIYEQAGIVLSDCKEALVAARIGKRLRQLNLSAYAEYYRLVEKDPTRAELAELLSAISTNTTCFFRESRHFDIMAELVRQWEQQGQSRFRVWCAAAATGEEPYTIAMTLREHLRFANDARILATDIDRHVLCFAAAGTYDAARVEKLPKGYLPKYFRKLAPEDKGRTGANYQVAPELARMVAFRYLNLSKPPFPLKGPLDVIFCRNVMIYFDNDVRRPLLAECTRLLKPGGYLFVGHSEGLSGQLCSLTCVQPSVYIKT